jgi:hydrophobic/amphiphilic exporter-1 (mainly G- bacteria), HAE1 family
MKLIETSIRYPVSVIVGVLLATLFGVLALLGIPLQMVPTVDRPIITVETRWTGASPKEVEEEITDRLEEQLNSVEGLSEITSSSSDGTSTIVLQFDWGTDKDVARLEVSEKIGLVGNLPDEADEPVIKAANTDEENKISWIVLKSELPVNDVRILADDVMRPRFERVEGVGSVDMFGGEEREVHVLVDPDALAARGIPFTLLRSILLGENRNVKAGGLEEGKSRFVIRTVGQFTDLEEIGNTVLTWQDGNPVYVKEVADVRFSYADRLVTVRQNGQPAMVFGIARKTGANSVDVMKRVRAVVADLNEQYVPVGIELEAVYDETEYIDDSVDLVSANLLYGAALAVVVLLLFLRSGVSTLIVGFTIPISVVVTFIFLQIFDRSLNIISLAGLAFAVGMVVDNAIVVLENIFRHQQMGKSPMNAAYDGTKEVWGAILSSTLTTLAVFIPILFVQQEAGQLFRDIAIALSCSIGMSLLVSITVIPMLSSRLLKVKKKRRFEFVAGGGTVAVNGITTAVGWLTAGFTRKLVTSVVIIAGAVFFAFRYAPPMDYLPSGNRPLILTILLTPPGFNTNKMESILSEVEQRYLARPEVEHMFSVALPDDPIVGVIIRDEDSDKATMHRLTGEFQQMNFGIPGVSFPIVTQLPLFGGNFGGGDLEITVRGPDLATIQGLAGQLMGGAMGIQEKAGFTSVRPSFELGKPEVQIIPDREKAAALGLSVADIGFVVGTMVDGTLAGEFREQGRKIDLLLRGPPARTSRVEDLLTVPLVTPTGNLIQLGDVVSLLPVSGPATIEHNDLDRSVKILIGVDATVPLDEARGVLLEEVVGPLRQRLPGLEYTIDLVGQARDLDRTWVAVRGSFVLAVIIVYLLMAALFESFAVPIVIILSVPLALTGGIFGLAITRYFDPTVKMDVITMLGFVILAGVVVNNAILIVHQTLNNIREGMGLRPALLESVRSRVRPIFMSTTTSVMGMLPLVLSSGSGTELYRGLGAVVVGGLALSTVFTLFLIPTLLSLSLDLRELLTKVFGAKPLSLALRESRAFHAEED